MKDPLVFQVRSPHAMVLKEKQIAQEEIEQLRSDLLLSQPFVALLAMRLKIVVVLDDRLPTACTDSHHIFFNLDFIKNCSLSQKRFVLAHEVWHCVMGHFLRQQHRHQICWNYACDYEINGILTYFFNHDDMPRNVLFNTDFIGKSAENIYQQLVKLPENKWVKTGHFNGKRLPTTRVQFDQHQPKLGNSEDSFIRIDPDYSPHQPTSLDVERWREFTTMVGQITGLTHGKNGANLQQIVNNLLWPQLDWTTLLQRFIQRTIYGSYQWHKPARRFIAQGLYLPSRTARNLEISLAIDTSASTLGDLPKFLAELTAILQEFDQIRLQVISCDAKVTDVRVYEKNDLGNLKQWRAKGLGGTSFIPVFKYIADGYGTFGTPTALIYFTDGFGDAQIAQPDYPVLWVVSPHGQKPVDWGEALYLQ